MELQTSFTHQHHKLNTRTHNKYIHHKNNNKACIQVQRLIRSAVCHVAMQPQKQPTYFATSRFSFCSLYLSSAMDDLDSLFFRLHLSSAVKFSFGLKCVSTMWMNIIVLLQTRLYEMYVM